jgi:hypothetical protein
MKEQAPGGDLGGEQLQLWLGLSREEIEIRVSETNYEEFFVERTELSSSHYPEDKNQLIKRIDELLVLFGKLPTDWAQFVKDVHYGQQYDPTMGRIQAQRAHRAGSSLGEFWWDKADADFDIEHEEEGPSEVSITVELSDNTVATLYSHGDFWTERTFKHPVTGEKLFSGDHESEINDLEDEYGEIELINSTIDYALNFKVIFSKRGD